jgi:Ribosomal protein S7e
MLLLQALFDLEATNAELKSDLRDLYITSAQEVDVSSGRKAIIIHVSWCCALFMMSDLQQPQQERQILSSDSPSRQQRNAAALQQTDGQYSENSSLQWTAYNMIPHGQRRKPQPGADSACSERGVRSLLQEIAHAAGAAALSAARAMATRAVAGMELCDSSGMHQHAQGC